MSKASGVQEICVVASCPEFHHDAVQEICRKMTFVKAFGHKGDCVDDISGDWVDKWKMRLVQAVTTSLQLNPECSTAKIYCIEGGRHCNEEMAAVPNLKKAIQKEMAQMQRTVRTPLFWLSFEEFEEEISKMAKEAAAQETADNAAEAAQCGYGWYNPMRWLTGRSDIHATATYGNAAAVRHLLLEDPSAVHTTDNGGTTALHVAAIHGRREIAELLLAQRAAVDATNIAGRQPLHLAALMGHPAVVEVLLGANAPHEAKTNTGRTPLCLAREEGHHEVITILAAASRN
eukprot:Skav215011  [mRNA]  locus=scaffold966:20429:21295:+ [translate_table: standard]